MSTFTHLHTHSHYSLLTALPTIPELIAAAKSDGMEALALTDNGNLYGAIEFYKTCKDEGIQPIIGIDAYVAIRTRFDRESGVDNRRHRLVLLAENTKGYHNLIHLVTESYLHGFYYKPRIDHALMEERAEGLIAILPSFASEVSAALKQHDKEKAAHTISLYKKIYGEQSVFLEVTHHPEMQGHSELMEQVLALGKETNTQLVAAHDVYYLKKEDRLARETMLKIQGGTVDAGGFDDDDEDFSFISQETAKKYFAGIPEALANTEIIAKRCTLEIEMQWTFPNYIIESGRTADDELHHTAMEGIPWRNLSYENPEIKERIDYELEVIRNKGYATYFLVVGDLLREARKRGILTTIRGSVAGSLTTYVLGITNVNPLDYKLPFERFLNPERPSAPDIDMDFADDRRDEMIAYAKEKYGDANVAQIGTFGTMLARAVVRDVARALGFPYATGDTIAKLIPMGSQGFPMTIERAFEMVPELKELHKKDEEVQRVIALAKKIEGRVRHVGVHAAGVVIAPKPLIEYVPLQFDPKAREGEEGKLITQFDMHAVGEDGIGLLKFDFLGIKNLSILADAVKRVQETQKISVDIENIPLDDQRTFEMLARGETMGLFQLNGSGMTRFLKELKPSRIHDINAMVALYRPGPMESIPAYIERKHSPHLISYLDVRMKDILDQSFGVITYQDDVMMIAIKLAGYSWLEADKLRKAMGKKIPAVMAAEKEKLQEGLLANGMVKEKTEKLWKLIEPFAAYGFNKAHAASYGRVAYQTAYMKANFPVEYMAAVLTADSNDIEKIAEAVAECQRMNIPVLAPSINESFGDFTCIQSGDTGAFDAIRFGLYSIKNFGEGIADAIIEEREKNGTFSTLEEFLSRVQHKNLNRKSLEALIKAGALDFFEDRGRMFNNIEVLLTFSKEIAAAPENQNSLFGDLLGATYNSLSLPSTESVSEGERLAWEKELLGLYLSGHPLDKYKEQLAKHDVTIEKARNARQGVPLVIYGIVEDSRSILTKGGETMAFLRLADLSGSIEAVCFPSVFNQFKDALAKDACVGVKGHISGRNGERSLIIEKVKALE